VNDKSISGVIGVVIVIAVISAAVTGTDTGSTLLKTIGPLVAGAGGLYVLIKSFM